jgi:hypothetical protein
VQRMHGGRHAHLQLARRVNAIAAPGNCRATTGNWRRLAPWWVDDFAIGMVYIGGRMSGLILVPLLAGDLVCES